MPKLRTKKAVSKRLHITKKKKILKRKGGQDHFNARESGKVKRNKRRDGHLSKSFHNVVKKNMPYA